VAVGIGTTLLLHCDLVYAAESAAFSLPFSQLGLCPEAASSLLLPRLAGYPLAAEKLLLGETFDAQEAHRMGIVNRLLPAAEVDAFAYAQAVKLSALPASSLRVTKMLMKRAKRWRRSFRSASLTFGSSADASGLSAAFLALLEAPEAPEARWFRRLRTRRSSSPGKS
jgi:enoyl-CoA hydratase/carnithine racemase